MKKLHILLLMIFVGIISCVKDEDLKDPTPTGNGDSTIFLNELVSTGSPDYIELYNSSKDAVDISGYTISDGSADFVIPSGISVEGKGYLVLLADDAGKVDNEGIHTNFKISSKGEPIKLVDKEGFLVDQIDLPPMDPGTAYGRITDGGPEWGIITPSPGKANGNTSPKGLVLNEIQGKGDPDYIELYNGTDADIDLEGYQLHDKDSTEAYVVPAGTIIQAGGFWTLDCDKDVYTKFKISSSGENVTLRDASGKIVDQLLEKDWPAGHAGLVGRIPDGGEKWAVLSEESKGSSNGN